MAHVAKYTRGQVGALARHFERAKNIETKEYIKFGNQDIDLSRTHENYNLASDKNQLEFIKRRCDEVHCLKRKDVNVMCSWVVTAPKDLPKVDETKFFKETYKFLINRYGGEKNVISAYVHKDEITPHMHFSFVPVVYDQKNNRDTVSAKIMLNRMDLKTFHSDLENHLKLVFNREIGILNEATKEGNLSIEELKRKSAQERLEEIQELTKNNVMQSQQELNEAREKASKIVSDANQSIDGIKYKLGTLNVEYDAKKAYVDTFKEIKESFNVKEIKSMMGMGKVKAIEVSPEDWAFCSSSRANFYAVAKMKEQLEKSMKDIQSSEPYQLIEDLKQEISKLKKELNTLHENNKKNVADLKRITKVFDKNPEIEKQFYKIEKEIIAQEQKYDKSMDWGMER